MRVVEFIIFIVWVVFWVGWLAAAAGTKPGRMNWSRGAGIRVAILAVVLVLIRVKALSGHVVNTHLWLGLVGLAIFLAGIGLAVWARLHIGRNWGTPMTRKDDPDLVTSGPYSVVRHPIYSGIILALIGTAVAVSVIWLIPVAVLGAYFVYSARVEERYMTSRFPEAYPEYKESTKMLVPFVF